MDIGIVYPQTEYGSDPKAIRDFAQAAEGLGFTHISAYDHVLGANPHRPGGWDGPYTHESAFLEPFVLFSYMAGVTESIGFFPGVVILPQRQTALVAKQAACLDVLSGGRLRLGVGIGWNAVEYEALGQDFHRRGQRLEEQVALLRALWTSPLVTFKGTWDTVSDAGLNPLPIQRPIPIWFGGHAERALRRLALLGDGWLTTSRSPQETLPALNTLRTFLREGHRDAASFGIEARVAYSQGGPKEWQSLSRAWQSAGVTSLSLITMGAGLNTASDHLAAMEEFAKAMGISRSG